MFGLFQYLLPQHALSRLVGWITRVRTPWFKNLVIGLFVRGYRPDMSDAIETDPWQFASFNEFFTRSLRAAARPLGDARTQILSPVDGTISELGRIDDDRLLQAKKRNYTLLDLLAGDADTAEKFRGGEFATIYLAPYNYHRIHMPADGCLVESVYVPGRLFSVNRTTVDQVPRLFARNERVICRFAADGGPFAVILVGALNVGSMDTIWHGHIAPRRPRRLAQLPVSPLLAAAAAAAGDELGRFNMGSTVILLFPPGHCSWRGDLAAGKTVRMGEPLAQKNHGS